MRILKIKSKNLKGIISQATDAINNGEIVICPTDTVYGLLGNASNKKAVEKIFKIKKRTKGKPIPIFVKDIKIAKKLAFIDREKEKFLKMVWPGKVTVVLKRRNVLPKILSGRTKTIGLRVPDYKLVNNLLLKLNRPLTGTSANISGKPASTKIREVIKQFEKGKIKPNLILDAGNLKPSSPSKVINLAEEKIKILRR
jgi:L-threonylcarbamoyladenylate synthase